MKTRTIGKVFKCAEYGLIEVVPESDKKNCYGCIFEENNECCENNTIKDYIGFCSSIFREDGKGVIFVKVKGGEK